MKATYIDSQWVIAPNIYGGKITSETTIDVGTNATVGKLLRLKAPTSSTDKTVGIVFNGETLFSGPSIFTENNMFMTATSQYLNLIGSDKITLSTDELNLEYVTKITGYEGKITATFG